MPNGSKVLVTTKVDAQRPIFLGPIFMWLSLLSNAFSLTENSSLSSQASTGMILFELFTQLLHLHISRAVLIALNS